MPKFDVQVEVIYIHEVTVKGIEAKNDLEARAKAQGQLSRWSRTDIEDADPLLSEPEMSVTGITLIEGEEEPEEGDE